MKRSTKLYQIIGPFLVIGAFFVGLAYGTLSIVQIIVDSIKKIRRRRNN